MNFDPLSYLLGVLTGSGASYATWRLRKRLLRVQESAEAGFEGTRRFIGQASDVRYRRDLVRYLQSYHLAGGLFDLGDVLLEPRLMLPPDPLAAPGTLDEADRDVFDVVPVYHDMPQSYAPYNVHSITLDDLGSGDRHVALLGLPGMGKSTALAALALMALGEVSFETLEDLTEQAIAEEEKDLTEKERQQRAEERQQMQVRALEKLHTVRQEEEEYLAQPREELPRLNIPDLMPIFVHLSDLMFDLEGYGKDTTLDPSEPLIRAVQNMVTAVTSQVVGSVLYPALDNGMALVLLDGYDELNATAQARYYFWLKRFLEAYGQNMVVITGPATGYESLTTLGFTPAYLRAWQPIDYARLAGYWGNRWASVGKRGQEPPDEQALRRISADNQGRIIADVVMKIWAGLADDTELTGRAGWYDAYVDRLLSEPAVRGLLPQLGAQMMEAGEPLPQEVLQATIEGYLAGLEKAPKADVVWEGLLKDGLLVQRGAGTFALPHGRVASYLASETLANAEPQQVADLALDTVWQDAMAFAAAHINLVPALEARLGRAPDLLYSDLFDVVRWLPDAPADASWRGDLFKRMAAALMAGQQYPAVRERAMAALVAARDKNVLFILRQALRAANPDVRRLACIGLGAVGETEVIRDIAPLLGDKERDVQLSAGLALGAIGSEHALEVMVQGLLSGTDELRRAVAEALAAIPGEGHAILRDGIVAQELSIRRASVYGLARIEAPWALVALYRAMLEDEQWYVRTAAEEAFVQAQSPEQDGPRTHPEADMLLWLIRWAADRGEGVPAGPNARQVLIRVLQEGEPVFQVMAARTLGWLGHVPALKPLYAALRERDVEVRSAAYAALADLQFRLGTGLPGLV